MAQGEGCGGHEDAVRHEDAEPAELAALLEALLIVSDSPVDPAEVAASLGLPPALVLEVLQGLAAGYESERRGFRLRETAQGWRFTSAPDFAATLARLVLDTAPVRLTTAALETLAVVAYLQPVTRGRVSAVRGVNVDAVMRTLAVRGLVAEQGRDEATGAVLFGTTPMFLDKLGIRSLSELPPLADYLPDDESLKELIGETST